MPELPEVEFARRSLSRWLLHRRLTEVDAPRSRLVRGSPMAVEELAGHRVEAVGRHGKWIEVTLDHGLALALHLGMTGRLVRAKPDEEVRFSRARLVADGTVVHFADSRRFGRMAAGPRDELRRVLDLDALGPDAWDEPPTPKRLGELLSSRKRAVKDALMDQTLLAGLGNIQATEALWKARVHPARPAASLDAKELATLATAIHWSLARTLDSMQGDDITYVEEGGDNPFAIYDRTGEPCPRCRTTLKAMRIGGRTSVFCPKCQTRR